MHQLNNRLISLVWVPDPECALVERIAKTRSKGLQGVCYLLWGGGQLLTVVERSGWGINWAVSWTFGISWRASSMNYVIDPIQYQRRYKVFPRFLWAALLHALQVSELSTCVSPSNICIYCGPSQVRVHSDLPKGIMWSTYLWTASSSCHSIPFRQVMENNEALLLECYQSWPCFV